uniref:Uncharacterized protein n=1 Tax=Meloidogyne hapla TaxID=6305 RepID=A0A1I8BE27_MELHA
MNICVTPGVGNIKELSYCIYIEYNIVRNVNRKINFVGTQEIGVENDCKLQQFEIDHNMENIQFIVIWSENIFFGKDDVLYESRFNVTNEQLVTDRNITLNINAVEQTKLDHKRKPIFEKIQP